MRTDRLAALTVKWRETLATAEQYLDQFRAGDLDGDGVTVAHLEGQVDMLRRLIADAEVD